MDGVGLHETSVVRLLLSFSLARWTGPGDRLGEASGREGPERGRQSAKKKAAVDVEGTGELLGQPSFQPSMTVANPCQSTGSNSSYFQRCEQASAGGAKDILCERLRPLRRWVPHSAYCQSPRV